MPMIPGLLLRHYPISSFPLLPSTAPFFWLVWTYTPNGKKLPTPPRTMRTPVARFTMRLRCC